MAWRTKFEWRFALKCSLDDNYVYEAHCRQKMIALPIQDSVAALVLKRAKFFWQGDVGPSLGQPFTLNIREFISSSSSISLPLYYEALYDLSQLVITLDVH
jgi:hypothetical protein